MSHVQLVSKDFSQVLSDLLLLLDVTVVLYRQNHWVPEDKKTLQKLRMQEMTLPTWNKVSHGGVNGRNTAPLCAGVVCVCVFVCFHFENVK